MMKKSYTLTELQRMGTVVTRAHGEIAVVLGKTARESKAFARREDGRYESFESNTTK